MATSKKPNYTQILQYALAHPLELMVLIDFAGALQSKDEKRIRASSLNMVRVLAADVNTTNPRIKKALVELSAALSETPEAEEK